MNEKSYTVTLTKDQKKNKRSEFGLALISGLMLGLSFPPLPFYILIFFALIPYFFVLEKRESLAGINRITYVMAFIYNAITLYWVGSWQPDTDPFLMIAGVTLLFFNPIIFLIPSTLYYFAKKSFNRRVALFLFPLFWVAAEFLYSITDFRFPWVTLGHSLAYFKSFIQIAEFIGSFGLGILVIYINVFAYLGHYNYRKKKKFLVYEIAALLLFLLPIFYGGIAIDNTEKVEKKVKVGIIQPNLNPWKKWEAGNVSQQLELYLELSQKEIDNGAELLIWPETALPVYLLAGGYEKTVQSIHSFCDTNNVYILTGMPHANFYFDSTKAPPESKKTKSGTNYTSYNSILLFQPNSREVPMYGKIKLVPFGEKVPLVEHIPFLGDLIKWNVGISSWNEGTEHKVFEIDLGKKKINVAGVVCIESIYPRFISEFVANDAELIVVVTNDSWYGDSSGPYQHKEMSVLRAVENRRSVVRSANGGISCVIDKYGKTLIETGMFEKNSFSYDVELNSDKTVYSKTSYLLPWISLVSSIFIMFVFMFNKIKNRKT